MKKGQAELLGLVMIVILLIFALLFFVKIKQDDQTSVTLRSSFRANNLLNAIMNVNLDDSSKQELKQLLKNCADRPIDCSTVKSYLEDIFEKTLLSNEKYEFDIRKGEGNSPALHVNKRGDCEEGVTASPVFLPNDYVFQLKLCS